MIAATIQVMLAVADQVGGQPGWIAAIISGLTAVGVGLDKYNYYRRTRTKQNVEGKIDQLTSAFYEFRDSVEADAQTLHTKLGDLEGDIRELRGYIKGRSMNGSGL